MKQIAIESRSNTANWMSFAIRAAKALTSKNAFLCMAAACAMSAFLAGIEIAVSGSDTAWYILSLSFVSAVAATVKSF